MDHIKKYVANKLMQDSLFASKKASWLQTLRMKASVNKEVENFFKATHEEGALVVHDGYSDYIEKLPNEISYEWFCNELYFMSIENFGSFSQTVEYILGSITQKLLRFKGRKFCICLSCDENPDSITVNFHTYLNELYISENIEGFDQPVLYIIIQT